jgi:transcription initiation factor IIE alpha subunit
LPIVLLIDALDECEDDKAESAILSVLATQLASMISVKFFITSRPVDNIRAAFRQPKLDKLTRRRELHTVDRATIDRDMKSFFATRLPKEVENREDFTPPPDPWPAANEVSSLVKHSDGLFIYASTILKFIISRNHDPNLRLKQVVNMVDTFLTGKAGLDDLYLQILILELAKSVAGDSDMFSDFRLLVGCILLAFNPLSRTSLAKILDMDLNHTRRVLRHLHSVLIIPDSASDLITAAHKSFPDFLTDPSRCKDTRFYIDCNVQHAVLAIQCLKLMKRDLKMNICSIPERTQNKEVKDLARLRQERIGDALEYSCRFFGRHIREAAGGEVNQIVELLKVFVEHLVLQWLEVLSIVGHMREAVYSLNYIKGWLVKVRE